MFSPICRSQECDANDGESCTGWYDNHFYNLNFKVSLETNIMWLETKQMFENSKTQTWILDSNLWGAGSLACERSRPRPECAGLLWTTCPICREVGERRDLPSARPELGAKKSPMQRKPNESHTSYRQLQCNVVPQGSLEGPARRTDWQFNGRDTITVITSISIVLITIMIIIIITTTNNQNTTNDDTMTNTNI